MAVEVRGIRLRSTAFVVMTLAVALLVGGIVITSVLRNQLTNNLDATLGAAAADRSNLLGEGADPEALTNTQLRESFVWIGTSEGVTLASGGRLNVTDPFADLTVADIGTRSTRTIVYTEDHDGEAEISSEKLGVAVSGVNVEGLGDVFVVVAQ